MTAGTSVIEALWRNVSLLKALTVLVCVRARARVPCAAQVRGAHSQGSARSAGEWAVSVWRLHGDRPSGARLTGVKARMNGWRHRAGACQSARACLDNLGGRFSAERWDVSTQGWAHTAKTCEGIREERGKEVYKVDICSEVEEGVEEKLNVSGLGSFWSVYISV